MTNRTVAYWRMHNQLFDAPRHAHPADVVRHLAAVQAQEYADARWSLALRLPAAPADSAIEQALTDGQILRTHVLRPTWHFVAPQDLRWLQMLTGPRVHQQNAGVKRTQGLDDETLRRACAVFEQALGDHNYKTRAELRTALHAAGIASGDTQRMAYIVMHAELEALICSGPRRGNQFTYALVAERAPAVPLPSREEALVELARRFFISRGPADEHDFARWSGLTLGDARHALNALGNALIAVDLDGRRHWAAPEPPPAPPPATPPVAHLLPVYDELISGYRDRSAIIDPQDGAVFDAFGTALLSGVLLVDGQVQGVWKRTLGRSINVIVRLFRPPADATRAALAAAVARYGAYHQRPAMLAYQ